MISDPTAIDLQCINTLRTLSMDAVQKADSGHPGAPMALAPVAYTLWQQVLRYNPDDTQWPNRDRFVLSNGHASMLLYSLLFLADVKGQDGKPAVSLDDIKTFRQLHSRCPGHPEYGFTPGVETTTGPLGQGVATSVGMAIASKWLGAHFNRPGFELFDYRTYALCGDGDMMEGISSEAASLAGHLKLSNLCWIYDNNHISIDGNTSITFNENVGMRFEAYGWRVQHVKDANDLSALAKAFDTAAAESERPMLVIVDSIIGYGSPKRQNTAKAHGEALGEDEVRAAKRNYGWPEDEHFLVPAGVREQMAKIFGKRGRECATKWSEMRAAYSKAHPELARDLNLLLAGELPEGWDKGLAEFPADPKGMATRVSGAKALGQIADQVPWLVGGAADLAGSTKTVVPNSGSFEPGSYGGRNIHFGVREHAMCAIANGLTLCGLRAFASSFLIFTDYGRPAMRLSALMELPVIYPFTHDSIQLGEDGPTHQPIEHLASFRAMPGMVVIRPADANETVEAWRVAMTMKKQPVLMPLTRQNVPTIDRKKFAPASGLRKGAYVLADAPEGKPRVLLLSSGSEVSLCLEAFERLKSEGIAARVVSMPSWDLFEQQSEAYRESVLPPEITARLAVEAAAPAGWERYLGKDGVFLGMRTFGVSAPLKELEKNFGFTVDHVVETAKLVLEDSGPQCETREIGADRAPH